MQVDGMELVLPCLVTWETVRQKKVILLMTVYAPTLLSSHLINSLE